MTIGSLFAGVGGLELGLERAGLGPVRWQVEINPYRRSVLAKHWPHAERFEDVRLVNRSALAPVDLICGGFPCKDVSSAGKRAGLAGPQSGLWHEFARLVEEMRPRWVVVENVTSGANAWVDAVRGDLERIGYATLPVPLAASDCGAFHHRRRIFVVSHADRESWSLPFESKVPASSASSNLDGDRGEAWNQHPLSLELPSGWDHPSSDLGQIPNWSDGLFARLGASGSWASPRIGHCPPTCPRRRRCATAIRSHRVPDSRAP